MPSREDYQVRWESIICAASYCHLIQLEARPVPVQPVAAQQIQQAAASPVAAQPFAAAAQLAVQPIAVQQPVDASVNGNLAAEEPVVAPVAEVKKASATGWIDPPNRGPPAVGQANTPPPSSVQESLPDISNADKLMKPPLKDFSNYQFGTDFDKVRRRSSLK